MCNPVGREDRTRTVVTRLHEQRVDILDKLMGPTQGLGRDALHLEACLSQLSLPPDVLLPLGSIRPMVVPFVLEQESVEQVREVGGGDEEAVVPEVDVALRSGNPARTRHILYRDSGGESTRSRTNTAARQAVTTPQRGCVRPEYSRCRLLEPYEPVPRDDQLDHVEICCGGSERGHGHHHLALGGRGAREPPYAHTLPANVPAVR